MEEQHVEPETEKVTRPEIDPRMFVHWSPRGMKEEAPEAQTQRITTGKLHNLLSDGYREDL